MVIGGNTALNECFLYGGKMYLERLKIFSEDNIYYKENGRFNDFQGDARMPNCTTYAFLRLQEMCDFVEKNNTVIRKSGGFGNAKTWYDTTTLPKGKTIKDGCIGVWDGEFGHVAVIERSLPNHKAIITQSQYDSNKSLRNYKYWERKEIYWEIGEATIQGIGKLIGFIYPSIDDIRTIRDTTKEQISINEEFVNVRGLPNGEVARKGCYAPMGTYDVLDIKNDGEYNWYQLDKSCWVRDGEWLTYYPIEENELQRLKAENKELKKENEILLNIIHDIHNMTGV